MILTGIMTGLVHKVVKSESGASEDVTRAGIAFLPFAPKQLTGARQGFPQTAECNGQVM